MTIAGRTTKLGFALYSSADVEYTFDPAWAPDSRRLAFGLLDLKAVNEEDRVGQSGVYVSTSAKAAPRRIARPSRVSEDLLEPTWSADGRWVAFEARAEVGAGYRSRIWLVRDNGTALRRVTSGKADSDPVWLPPSSGR